MLSGGAASARYFAARGAEVTVTDLLPAEALRKSIDALASWPVRYVLGEHREEDITGADLVVVGPAAALEPALAGLGPIEVVEP